MCEIYGTYCEYNIFKNINNNRLEVQLSKWEQKHFFTRWLPSDKEYKELEYSLIVDKQEQLLELWKTSNEVSFTLLSYVKSALL